MNNKKQEQVLTVEEAAIPFIPPFHFVRKPCSESALSVARHLLDLGTSPERVLKVVTHTWGVEEASCVSKELNLDLTSSVMKNILEVYGEAKTSYPYMRSPIDLPVRDLKKWNKILFAVEHLSKIRPGLSVSDIVDYYTKGWDPFEKEAFEYWMKKEKEPQKYNLKVGLRKEAQTDKDTVELQLIDKKKQLLSRVRAIDKILNDLSIGNLITYEARQKIEQILNNLQSEIRGLRSVAMIKDRVLRAASILEKNGFAKGSFELLTALQEKVPAVTYLNRALEILTDLQEKAARKEMVRKLNYVALLLDKSGFPTKEVDAALAALIGSFRTAENNINEVLDDVQRVVSVRQKQIETPKVEKREEKPKPVKPRETVPTART